MISKGKSNMDLSIIIAGLALIVSGATFYYQRRDVEVQNKYKRVTFELQSKISENSLITEEAAVLIGSIIKEKETLIRWYTLTYEHQRYKKLYIEKPRKDEKNSSEDKDEIAIEALKDLVKEQIDDLVVNDREFQDTFFKKKTILELILEGSENKDDIFKVIDEVEDIFKKMSYGIYSVRIEGIDIPRNKISDWNKKYDALLEPRIILLKKYFISSKRELLQEIEQIKKG